jgi:hypothetical protein
VGCGGGWGPREPRAGTWMQPEEASIGPRVRAGYFSLLTLKDNPRSKPLVWAALGLVSRSFRGLGLGGGVRVIREGGAACRGEGWLAARSASPPGGARRRLPRPAVCVCTHRSGVGGGADRGVVGTRVGRDASRDQSSQPLVV